MKKNASLTQFKGLNTINISSPSPVYPQKKMQGFDMTSSTPKSSLFTNKIQNLKTRPNKQSIEGQYINGLQDEIHYLEMQLKLLQEKDQAKHGQIDQLQKFFSDGVPINENILAIKNGFNNYKNQKEKTINQQTGQKKQREILIEGLTKRIKEMEKQLEKEEKDIRVFETTKTAELHSLVKVQAKLKKQIQLEDDQLKTLKFQNRKLSQKLTNLQRNKEIEMVRSLKNENHKMDKLSKIKESISQKQSEYSDLQKQYQELLKQEEEKSYVIKIEEENLNLKKKAISMQRELNALDTKAKEKQMDLDAKLKERYKEITAKTEMRMRLQTEKTRINKENTIKVEDIQKVAKEKEIFLLQKIITEKKKLSKYTEYYGNLLTKVEDAIQTMVEKKPQLKSEIGVYTSDMRRFSEKLQEQRARQSDLYSQVVESEAKIEYYHSVTPPLVETIHKTQDHIKMYRSESEKLTEDIKIKEKQLQLILILRSLNLQEVEMSKSSSSNIQDKLIGFIRSWQQLQRTG